MPRFFSLNIIITLKGQGVEREKAVQPVVYSRGQAAAPAVSLPQRHCGARGSLSLCQRDWGGSASAPQPAGLSLSPHAFPFH